MPGSDATRFGPAEQPRLVLAVEELSWLLDRDYPPDAALKLVGDRHGLAARQRAAVRCCACGDRRLAERRSRQCRLRELAGAQVTVDGYNVLVTLHAAAAGAPLLIGRDGCVRDLAGAARVDPNIARLEASVRALHDLLCSHHVRALRWVLDRPVSGSGRLGRLISASLQGSSLDVEVILSAHADRFLAEAAGTVASSDSWVLDRCDRWANLAAALVEQLWPSAWTVPLGGASAR